MTEQELNNLEMLERRAASLQWVESEFVASLCRSARELLAENAAVVADRDRLRAGLEFMKRTKWFTLGPSATIDIILAGADLRDPAQAEAVRQGTWHMEHQEVSRGE